MSLTGHQLNILRLLCQKCCAVPPYITCEINTDFIAKSLQIDIKVIRMCIKRLVDKDTISKHESKNGRSGWVKYLIPESSMKLIVQSDPFLCKTDDRLSILEETNRRLIEDNQFLKDENKKRKLEVLQVKEDFEKMKKKFKSLKSESNQKDKYFGNNIPKSIPLNMDIERWIEINKSNFKNEEPFYIFIEGSFEESTVHAIKVIDIHLKSSFAFKIGITNSPLNRHKTGYYLCGSFIVIFKTDHWEIAKKMEISLVEHYKNNPKIQNKSKGGEGNESQNGGPYYTYVAVKYKKIKNEICT